MGLWDTIRKTFAGDVQAPPSVTTTVATTTRAHVPEDGYDPRRDEGPVPPLTAVRRSARYDRQQGGSGSVEGHDWRTDDGRLMKDWCCIVGQWKRLGIYQVRVVGESFRSAKELGAAVPGEPAVLVPEPDNPHDANAISVRTTGGVPVGYVKATTTKTLRRIAKDGPVQVMFWARHHDERGAPCSVEVMMVRAGAATIPGALPEHPSLA
jgi:hypothetical protein